MSEPKDFPQDMTIETPSGVFLVIPFTRDEWATILSSLYSGGGVSISEDEMNIIDSIEKNLGIE